MGKHNDSMTDQGEAQLIAVDSANQVLNVASGVTNVELISSGGSTLAITEFGAYMRPMRILRFFVRPDQTFTARFTDSSEIEVAGGLHDLQAGDTIEFQCREVAGGNNPAMKWYEISETNIT